MRGRRGSQGDEGSAEQRRPLPLVGHEAARRRVRDALEQGRLAPVLLVTGPSGVGKESFGFWTARLLLCRGDGARPCGTCSSCVRIAALEHPDVHWFFPVPAESTFGENEWAKLLERIRAEPLNPFHTRFSQPASFRMHQAATIRRLAASKPFEGAGQVFLLGDYEQNPSDQVHNALLKVLEEPPPRTTFILTTCRAQGLPLTILSRCRQVRLGALSPTEMEEFLSRAEGAGLAVDGGGRERVLAEAEGRPGRALELIQLGLHESEDPASAEALELLRAVVAGGPAYAYEYLLRTSFRGSREEHGRRLDALAALWRDLLRMRAGAGEALTRPDLAALYRDAARLVNPEAGARAALELETAREHLVANVYAPLVFWNVFRALAASLTDGDEAQRDGATVTSSAAPRTPRRRVVRR